jgi:uncharacterized membrane protein (UPF0127 family)
VRRTAPALLLLALPSVACPSKGNAPHPAARVLVEAGPGVAAVRVEVARTPAARERGLMNRQQLDPDAGMLFVFDESAPHGFWMKNTLIPLDLLFLGEDGRVAAVVERRPLSLEVTDGEVESRYVLEVNGGWARAHGVRPGDRVRFENVLW